MLFSLTTENGSQNLYFFAIFCFLHYNKSICGLSDHVAQNGYSSLLSFTATDINNTVTRLMTLGAQLDGPIKNEIHGKVITKHYKNDAGLNFLAIVMRIRRY